MPDRTYRPPTALHYSVAERWRSHPFELTFAAVSILNGILLVIDLFFVDFDPAPSLETLPEWVQGVLALLLAAGGAGVHWSFWCSRIHLGTSWALERLSLMVLIGAWTVYDIAVITSSYHRVFQWMIGLAIILSLLIRWEAVGRLMHSVRLRQRQMRDEAGES